VNSELLDTAVKLAALGTSGVCVAALVWTGLLMARLPPDAERNRHGALRNYMLLCFAVAVVSAVSGFFSPTAERIRELEATNREQAKQVAALQKTVQEDQARNDLVRDQVRTIIRLLKVNAFVYGTVGPYLDKILELLGPEKPAAQ
jgi:uncharacterized coiled-coil protein SlyX